MQLLPDSIALRPALISTAQPGGRASEGPFPQRALNKNEHHLLLFLTCELPRGLAPVFSLLISGKNTTPHHTVPSRVKQNSNLGFRRVLFQLWN